MTLIRTTQAGYVYRPDVYTDEHGRSFAVYPDTDAEDPRTWSAIEEAALVVIDGDRNTCIDALCDYQENPAIACFNELLDGLGTDDPHEVSIDQWRAALRERNLDYDVAITTCRGYSQSDWFTILAAVRSDCGTVDHHVKTYRMWALGDVWTVAPIDSESSDGPLSGIYADDAESAVAAYITDISPNA